MSTQTWIHKRDAALTITFSEIDRVWVVLLGQTGTDELLDGQDRGWVELSHVLKDDVPDFRVKVGNGLQRKYLAVKRSCASCFLPHISTSFAFARPTRDE
ncbi:unnamed protein product [Mycena citricolor]|uniref:Uncharacterized protein n=1 Tax=Mycena citricolor TaxID=2018698 RepID=A0AAD2HKN7_9AGAR|nr:unnamed protein product [Mycena citricolor]